MQRRATRHSVPSAAQTWKQPSQDVPGRCGTHTGPFKGLEWQLWSTPPDKFRLSQVPSSGKSILSMPQGHQTDIAIWIDLTGAARGHCEENPNHLRDCAPGGPPARQAFRSSPMLPRSTKNTELIHTEQSQLFYKQVWTKCQCWKMLMIQTNQQSLGYSGLLRQSPNSNILWKPSIHLWLIYITFWLI